MWNGEMWKSGALAPRKEYVLSGLLSPCGCFILHA